MYIRRRFPFANSAGLGVRRTLTKKGEKGAAAQGPTHRGHGFFSATRGLSKLSCDTARRRGAPALSSLVAHNLGFLEAPSSSLPLQLLIWVFSLFLFLENKTGKKENEATSRFETRRALGPELLRGYVREPCISVVVVVGQRAGAPTIVTRRPRPAFGEMWNFQCFIILGLHTFIYSSSSSSFPTKNDKVSALCVCVFCDPCWHRVLFLSKIGLRSYRAGILYQHLQFKLWKELLCVWEWM